MKKIVIAGGRTFSDQPSMNGHMDALLSNLTEPAVIISGTARGADQCGEVYAQSRGLAVIQMPADWDTHGKSAGYKRNQAMADIADGVVVFWDGESRGSQHMIDIAQRMNLPTRVIQY